MKISSTGGQAEEMAPIHALPSSSRGRNLHVILFSECHCERLRKPESEWCNSTQPSLDATYQYFGMTWQKKLVFDGLHPNAVEIEASALHLSGTAGLTRSRPGSP